MKIKRLLAAVLFFCLLLNCIPPVQTNAAISGYYTYTVSNGEATITDCSTSISGNITIPSTLGGYPVTAIGNCAFDYCSNLTSVEIPGSVTTIGQKAFLYCTGLKTVTLNDGIVTIGNRAFGDCTGLTSVVVPNSVTIIDHGAFSYCTRLTTASLPDGLTFVGEGVFRNCSRLQYNTYGNARYLGNENNPYAVLAQATSQTITDCQIHTDTKVISGGAFEECKNLTSIEIPYGVKGISDSAFAYCTQLKTVNIPDSVVRIGSYVFDFCSGLTEASIPNSVTTMGTRVFHYCQSLSSINLSNQLKSIGSSMFYNCISLTSVTIPNGVTTIDSEAFYGCTELKTLNIPHSITLVQGNAFNKCSKLTMVTFCGTADQWQKIVIGSSNDPLKNASRQYHNWNPATCTTPQTCSLCGVTQGDVVHSYTFEVTAPTCDKQGYTTHTCTNCGDYYVDSYVDASHSYESVVTEPTCKEQGYTTHTCGVCGDSYVDSYVDVTEHVYEDGACTICGDVQVHDHTWEDGACAVCGRQLAEVIELSGDGKVTVFDAQILAEAKAGLRQLTDAQWETLGDLKPSDILDYVLGRFEDTTTIE